MLLVELATQGVKGFSPSSRAIFKPGYLVAVPPAGLPPGTAALISALLFNDGRATDANLSTGTGPARAGLTVIGADGRTYRIVRSLGGAGALHRLEPNNTWTVVSQDTTEMNTMLRGALGLPTRNQFEDLFCFLASQFPSRRAPPAEQKPAAEQAKTEIAPEVASSGRKIQPSALIQRALAQIEQKPKLDVSMMQQNLETLRKELEQAKALEEQQFKLEGMQRRIFELEEKLKRLDDLVANVDATKESLRTGHTLQSLGLANDGLEKIQRFDAAEQKRQEQVKKVREEDSQIRDDGNYKPQPVWLERLWQVGMGAGVGTLGLGLALGGGARYLALLDIPAFGLAAMTTLKWLGDWQVYESKSRKVGLGKDREGRINADFDREYFNIKAAMKIVGADSGEELLGVLKRRSDAEAKLAELEGQLTRMRSDPSLHQALDEQEQLMEQAKALEAEIAQAGAGVTRDWRQAEQEIFELEETIAQASGGGAVPGGGGNTTIGVTALGGSMAPTQFVGKEDPGPKLLALAQDLFNQALEALAASMKDRAGQYLVALSDRRYTGVELDGRGNTAAVAPGRTVAAGQLDDRDRDLLYLALRLTLVEKYGPIGKVPVIVDEAFVGFDEAKLTLVSRMLKHIGTQTQVLHTTAFPAHQKLADLTVNL